MTQRDLFDHGQAEPLYPQAPGYKEPTTSREAAESMNDAATLRAACLRQLQRESLTADQVAGVLGESVLAIRPRLSELRALGLIRDSGQRGHNVSGRRAIIWEAKGVTDELERNS